MQIYYNYRLRKIAEGQGVRHIKSDLIFCGPQGERLNANTICKRIAAALLRAGCKEGTSSKSYRHTFITRCDNLGVPRKDTMRMVGHAASSQTDKYSHATPESLKAAAKKLAASPYQPGISAKASGA